MKRITMAATVAAFILSLVGFGFAAQGTTVAMNMQQHQALCGNDNCCGGGHHTQVQKSATQRGSASIFEQIQPSNEG